MRETLYNYLISHVTYRDALKFYRENTELLYNDMLIVLF